MDVYHHGEPYVVTLGLANAIVGLALGAGLGRRINLIWRGNGGDAAGSQRCRRGVSRFHLLLHAVAAALDAYGVGVVEQPIE